MYIPMYIERPCRFYGSRAPLFGVMTTHYVHRSLNKQQLQAPLTAMTAVTSHIAPCWAGNSEGLGMDAEE